MAETETMQIEKMITGLLEACRLSGKELNRDEIIVEDLSPGEEHRGLKNLPDGKMAVYIFLNADICLKVGKAFEKSKARYFSHHYNPNSSKSNLALSLGKTGDWIKDNTRRINILISSEKDVFTLNLCEAFFQALLKPIYEGFASQR